MYVCQRYTGEELKRPNEPCCDPHALPEHLLWYKCTFWSQKSEPTIPTQTDETPSAVQSRSGAWGQWGQREYWERNTTQGAHERLHAKCVVSKASPAQLTGTGAQSHRNHTPRLLRSSGAARAGMEPVFRWKWAQVSALRWVWSFTHTFCASDVQGEAGEVGVRAGNRCCVYAYMSSATLRALEHSREKYNTTLLIWERKMMKLTYIPP